MSKKNNLCIVIMMIFITLGMQVSNVIAVRNPAPNNEFFYTNKQEISIGEALEMTLDISKIKYNEFEFKLSSNLDANNIIINEKINVENYNNDISIDIDKSKTNIDKITLYYNVPENAQIGTKIELVAQIIVEAEQEIEQNTVADVSNNESNTTTTEIEYEIVESKKIDVKIVEKKQTNNQERPNEQINNNLPNEHVNSNPFEKTDKPNDNETNKSMPSNKQITSYSANTINLNSMSVPTETAVYNGSNNNYLASLEIEGESLNTTFNKENTTYFVQTSGKTDLSVITTAENDEAKINITGNENLKKGDNKILISVTAENGDVRYYRVFVTNN